MDLTKILSSVDHTILATTTTTQDIYRICDEAKEYKTASVCIPPAFVKEAFDYCKDEVAICTVIGFPNGYQTTETKVFETQDAIKNGACEIDMVICNGDLKAKKYDKIENEISQIKQACNGNILKVIIETCLLSDEEKIKMCEIVTKAGADFIKTSTGFSTGGATREDIILFKKHVGENVKIKAAGGIKSLQDAQDFIDSGASRLGTSSIVKLVKGIKSEGY
jgi:deoxyribose-phosphate aldolase